jgi:hypothetical protein
VCAGLWGSRGQTREARGTAPLGARRSSNPWGLVWLGRLGYGMNSGWFAALEGAFRESMAWDEPPPPGYEVD